MTGSHSFSSDEKESLGSERHYGSFQKASSPSLSPFQKLHKLYGRESTRKNIFARKKMSSIEDVPKNLTLLKDNVRLFTVDDIEKEGILYMNEEAFYNKNVDPDYALSVSPDLYRKMVDEVNDSYSIPLGLYFCCHGGDGAHSGIAHDDYVDIEVAYALAGVFFATIIFLVWILPTPVE